MRRAAATCVVASAEATALDIADADRPSRRERRQVPNAAFLDPAAAVRATREARVKLWQRGYGRRRAVRPCRRAPREGRPPAARRPSVAARATAVVGQEGKSTLSMAWITPFDANTSVATMAASFT
jgi:hypothetical protein